MRSTRREFLMTSAAVAALGSLGSAADEVPLIMVVTDPLAKDNSCPCVAGYGQRDYNELGKFLSASIGKPVQVHFAESVAGALKKKTAGKVDIVIGKDSMVRAQAKAEKIEVTRLAALTGKDGDTTQTGLLVVHSSDPTLAADQMKNYTILFGPEAAEEKHAAVKTLLKELNVTYNSTEKDIAATCSVCATTIIERAKAGEKVCGVVSSYAMPLLEGCGTINKGDLKVIGKTQAVPFIAVFAASSVNAEMQKKIQSALFEVGKSDTLCKVLETKNGFVDPDAKKK